MRIAASLGVTLALLAASVSTANAQLVEEPQGAIGGVFGGRRPIDPNRTTQSLDMSFDVSGGYEHDPNAFMVDSAIDLSGRSSWYASTASTAARYRLGNARRWVESRGRGIFNYQSNGGGWLRGGDVSANSSLQFGRSLHQLTAGMEASYEPGWVFGSLGSAPSVGLEVAGLGVAPPPGILEQRWLVISGSAGYEHHWNRRNVMRFHYANRRLRPLDGVGLDSDTQFVDAEHNWAATPNVSLLAAYRVDQSHQTGEIAPLRYQTVDGGLRFERRLSTTRRYSWSFRGGVSRLVGSAANDLEPMHPTLTGNVELMVSRMWSMSAEVARRTVILLAGVTALPVFNDSVELSISGTPSRRLRFALSGSFGRARTLASGGAGANVTEVAGATSEVRFGVARWAAAFASYGFYHHRLEDESRAISGFPSRYDRHSARVGLTVWVPLYGAF